jgi:hypothetical protein
MFKFVKIPQVYDSRGSLFYINNLKEIPFEIKRIFYVSDVPTHQSRGSHAHKKLQEVLIALTGSFDVEIADKTGNAIINLNSKNIGLLLPPSSWRVVKNYSPGAICLSLCSDELDEDDYLRTWQEFVDYYG